MAENETIKKWKQVYDQTDSIYKSDGLDDMFKMAVKALEEIQEYRVIGTVEEFKHYKRTVHMAELAIDSIDKEKAEIRNKAIKECLAVLYRNAGKFLSTKMYSEVYDEITKIAGQTKEGAE